MYVKVPWENNNVLLQKYQHYLSTSHNRYYCYIVITVAKLSGTSFHDTITDPNFYSKLFMEIALRVKA